LLLVSGCGGKNASEQISPQWSFHTNPDKWQDARVYHTPFDEAWSKWIVLSKTPLESPPEEKIRSPNRAYWFAVTQPDTTKPGPYSLRVRLYSERDYMLELELLNVYGNFERSVSWVNEKLLHIRVWWGRARGVDLVFDVEEEQFIYKETLNSGQLEFVQWQQAKTNI